MEETKLEVLERHSELLKHLIQKFQTPVGNIIIDSILEYNENKTKL